MSADMEERIRDCNSNEELRKAIELYKELKPALENSLSVLVDLLNSFFSKLSLKDKRFQTFSPCTDEELTNYHLPNDRRFNENISISPCTDEELTNYHLPNNRRFNENISISPCTDEELTNYHLPNDRRFNENISKLKKKDHLKNFLKFNEFLCTHTTRRTYYFHVFKCSTDDCPFHFPVRGKEKI